MEIPQTLADMHVHSQYSHDCKTPLPLIKALTKKYRLTIAITDHNRIGGSLAAHALKISVIPAIEVTTKDLKDFLIYFHEHDNLAEFYEETVHPSLDPGKIFGSRTTLTPEELIEGAKKYDSFISLAHPYCPQPKRSANIPPPIMKKIDAIEVMNFAMSAKANKKASTLRDLHQKKFTAGSDSHHPLTVGMVTMRGYGETPSEFLAEAQQGTTNVVGVQRTKKDVWDKIKDYLATKNLVPTRTD